MTGKGDGQMEQPGGVEIQGGDGLRTGGKCRVKEMKRQAGGEVWRRLVWEREKRESGRTCDINIKKSHKNIIGFTLRVINRSSHTHTHICIYSFTSRWQLDVPICSDSLSSTPTYTNILRKNPASAAAPSPKQSHLLSHYQQKFHQVDTLKRRG